MAGKKESNDPIERGLEKSEGLTQTADRIAVEYVREAYKEIKGLGKAWEEEDQAKQEQVLQDATVKIHKRMHEEGSPISVESARDLARDVMGKSGPAAPISSFANDDEVPEAIAIMAETDAGPMGLNVDPRLSEELPGLDDDLDDDDDDDDEDL